jgi:hypothetical protein
MNPHRLFVEDVLYRAGFRKTVHSAFFPALFAPQKPPTPSPSLRCVGAGRRSGDEGTRWLTVLTDYIRIKMNDGAVRRKRDEAATCQSEGSVRRRSAFASPRRV